MALLIESKQHRLQMLFGDRYRDDRVERKLYSFDVGALPSLIKPIIPVGLAGAVVRPIDDDEIVQLVKIARDEKITLVPRGMSTSGYGGVLPEKDAIIVDLTAMNRMLAIDAEHGTVTVQAGIVWESLQHQLHLQQWDLRLYPSSSPASTVGGWLAQGGSGFGSYEYGFFKENVLSASVIMLSGEIVVFTGKALADYVADAEGITGIITTITLRIRPLEAEMHRAIAFPDALALGKALSLISEAALPIWSMTFLNPESLRLKKKLPHKHGHPYEEAHPHYTPPLPEAFVLMIAYPTSRHRLIDQPLLSLLESVHAQILPSEAAEHEWDLRFAPMRLKRIGPSMIPTEVIVPLSSLSDVLNEIDEKIKQPFILEGMVGKDNKVTLLGFIPHDERTFAYNLAFALSLSVISIAKKHGGTAYSTGLYFKSEAKNVFGQERYGLLKEYKEKNDPHHLLNPHKILGNDLLHAVMLLATKFEPIIRPFANRATTKTGDFAHQTKDTHGIPGNVAFFATACARCGYCVNTCTQFSGRGFESHSPRGKYAYLREVMAGREKFDQAMIDKFLLCTTCEICNTRCQLNLPVEHNWMTMRGVLIEEEKKMTFPPFEMMAASLRGEQNIWAGKQEKRADWVPEDLAPKIQEKADVLYFAGCTASYVNTDVAKSTLRILDEAGVSYTYMGDDEACCGIPMKVAGKWDVFEEIFEHNVAEAKKRGAKTIVTSCPACGLVWKELYPQLAKKKNIDYDFEVKHYTEIAAQAIEEGKLHFDQEISEKVCFHDSCHAGRAQGIYEPPREVLTAMPGVEFIEMEHNRENGLCCGSVLTLIGESDVAPKLGNLRLQEAVDVQADTLLAMCPCCQVQLRTAAKANDVPIAVTDLARFIAKGLGYETEDMTQNSLVMWGYFEKFIALMQPDNMAHLMAALFAQMFEVMPHSMVTMMHGMKVVPGGYAMMEKMMPILMPRLVPGIMPKIMPAMLDAVSQRVGPLPSDMEELMPDLLPRTMEALLPNMLPELLPFITPMMIDYLRHETKQPVS